MVPGWASLVCTGTKPVKAGLGIWMQLPQIYLCSVAGIFPNLGRLQILPFPIPPCVPFCLYSNHSLLKLRQSFQSWGLGNDASTSWAFHSPKCAQLPESFLWKQRHVGALPSEPAWMAVAWLKGRDAHCSAPSAMLSLSCPHAALSPSTGSTRRMKPSTSALLRTAPAPHKPALASRCCGQMGCPVLLRA